MPLALTRPAAAIVPVWRALLDLVVPVLCAGCRTPGHLLCPRCGSGLRGRPFDASPTPRPAGLPTLHAAARYDGSVRAALLAHKERGVLRLARPLGRALSAAVGSLLDAVEAVGSMVGRSVLLVPVPSTRAAVRARGHDPTLRLCREAAHALGGGLGAGSGVGPAAGLVGGGHVRVVPGLRHARSVHDQAGLSAAGRAANLHGALMAVPSLVPALRTAPVVLVDDLVTTGATLVEATRALAAAGVPVVGAAVVAATSRRLDPPAAPG